MLADRLAMGLEVGRQHGKPKAMEESRALEHARSVRTDAMKKEHRPAASPATS
jgi:hypothetical protein